MFLSWIWFAILKYDKDCFRKRCERIKTIKSCCYGHGDHGDCSMKLFGSHKPCYDSQ